MCVYLFPVWHFNWNVYRMKDTVSMKVWAQLQLLYNLFSIYHVTLLSSHNLEWKTQVRFKILSATLHNIMYTICRVIIWNFTRWQIHSFFQWKIILTITMGRWVLLVKRPLIDLLKTCFFPDGKYKRRQQNTLLRSS